MIATEERLSGLGVVGFALPSAPAMYLNLAQKAYRQRAALPVRSLFDSHDQGVWPDNHAPLFDFLELMLTEIIFSFTAIESFANEVIPDNFKYLHRVSNSQSKMEIGKSEIERSISLDEKIKMVLPQALGVKSPAGNSEVWTNFKLLKRDRDNLIHLKSSSRRASGPEEQTIWGSLLSRGGVIYPNVAVSIIGAFIRPDRRWFRLKPQA